MHFQTLVFSIYCATLVNVYNGFYLLSVAVSLVVDVNIQPNDRFGVLLLDLSSLQRLVIACFFVGFPST